MRSNWTKLIAVLLLVAMVGTIMSLRQVAPMAYAVEQTLEANRGLRYIHIRTELADKGSRDAWAEFDENGQLLRLRMNLPKTEDGDKEVVFEGDRAEVWFKSKGHVLVLKDKKSADKLARELSANDPKLVMDKLHQAEKEGKVEVQTDESSAHKGLITLDVTYKDNPNLREVYRINSETKFLEQLDRIRMIDGTPERTEHVEYLEPNQQIPPGIFVLDIPADAMRVDWTTQVIGLPKGDLTDEQIAVKVAREFFKALIAKDYDRAGTIFEGIPGSKLEQVFGKAEFVRIVSIGEPTPHPNVRTRFLQVPCEVEMRIGEETHTKKFMPNIRANEGQPDRWTIGGGI